MIYKNRKLIISAILFVLISNAFCACFAFEIGNKEIVSLGECERLLTYNGIPVKTTYVVYQKDGVNYPAYCLDVKLPGAETGSYTVNGGSKIQDINVWRAVINGYPYKSLAELGAANEQEAFTATKQAVYTLLYGRDTSSYGAVDSESGRRTYQIYLNIVNNARNSSEIIVNNPQLNISCNSEEWKIDNLNKQFVSKTYNITSNFNAGICKLELEGNIPNNARIVDLNNNDKNIFALTDSFKVLIPVQSLLKTDSFKIKAIANFETKPVVYGTTNVPGKQDYALTGYMYEEQSFTYTEEYTKNITKLVIVKKEYGTENRLKDVKFNLLDSNKNIVMQDLITDENGEIILENMLPGQYFLQETETLENYNLYTDLIEINLDLNEEFKTVVNNSIKVIEEIEKDFEILEVEPSFKNTIYDIETKETINVENKEVINLKNKETITINEKETDIVKKLPVTGY